MTQFHIALMVIFAFIGMCFAFFHYVMRGKDPTAMKKRALYAGGVWISIIILFFAISFWHVKQQDNARELAYTQFKQLSAGHEYSAVLFKQCTQRIHKTLTACKIEVYKKVETSIYKGQWGSIRADLNRLIEAHY